MQGQNCSLARDKSVIPLRMRSLESKESDFDSNHSYERRHRWSGRRATKGQRDRVDVGKVLVHD